MANTHNLFLEFRKNLNIPNSQLQRLKSAEIAVKNQLKRYFANNPNYKIHHFKLQGSKSIGTLIRKDESIDLDLGVYFFPKPNVLSKTLMDNVYKALYGLRTHMPPKKKNKCIRVLYSKREKIHLDVPIFCLDNIKVYRNPKLATNSGWIKSDVSEFEKWFLMKRKKNPQLVQFIRYLKSWSQNLPHKMPNGVTFTVLVANYYVKNERDDIAFLNTIKNILFNLEKEFCCNMPAQPYDDLLLDFSKNAKNIEAFLTSLKKFVSDGEKAIEIKSLLKAKELWGKHFGINFGF